jgi:hypothetical protein
MFGHQSEEQKKGYFFASDPQNGWSKTNVILKISIYKAELPAV